MEKTKTRAFNKSIYLLGEDKEGVKYWLEEPSWDCGWYWGFGYIETYTNNRRPDLARDINSHQHFDSLFLRGNKCAHDLFKEFFKNTPLNNNEIWELCDYMMTFYTLRKTAELFRHGYSWQTERAKIKELENKDQEDLINRQLLPEVFKRIKKLLSPEGE